MSRTLVLIEYRNGRYVQPSGARNRVQRLVIHGQRHDLGLGSVALVSPVEARTPFDNHIHFQPHAAIPIQSGGVSPRGITKC